MVGPLKLNLTLSKNEIRLRRIIKKVFIFQTKTPTSWSVRPDSFPTRWTASSFRTNVEQSRASGSTKTGPFYWRFPSPDQTFDPYAGSASGREDWDVHLLISSFRHRSMFLRHWRRLGSIQRLKKYFCSSLN